MIRVAIRGFAAGVKVFEDEFCVDESDTGELIGCLAEEHAAAMAAHPLHMIEIEFLDESDPNQRFFRFGTDPGGIVLPLRVYLAE
jgi:hypothetical protein